MGPSEHLTWEELACHDAAGTPYPAAWRNNRARRLSSVFEGFRAHCGGKPMRVLSAYRTPIWNRKQGGAQKSQHKEGRAIDLRRPKGMTLKAFHALAREYATLNKHIGGLGIYTWGVHLDVRPRAAGRLVAWNQVPAQTRLHDA